MIRLVADGRRFVRQTEPYGLGLVAATAAATLAITWLALAGNPLYAFGAMAAGGAVVAAWNKPALLLYAYCFAIPFNFALPPGPAGTVARAAGIAFFVGYLVRRPAAFHPSAVPFVGWLFVGWAFASCLWAMNAGLAFQSWQSLAQLFVVTVLVAGIVASEPRSARIALWCYSISAALTAISGSIAYLQSPTLFLARAAAFSDQDPALWSSALLPAAIFLMGEIASPAVERRLRILAAPALMACVIGIAVSGTRSAWIAALVAVVAWLLVRRDPRQLVALVAGACALAMLVSAVPGMGDFLAERAGTSLASGGAGRTNIWQVGFAILAAGPVIGVGWANFPVAFGPYAISTSAAAGSAGVSVGRAAHNVLLGTSVELGLIGAVLLVGFLAFAFLSPAHDRMATAVRIALLSMLVQSMFLDLLLQKQLWLLLGIVFGLAAPVAFRSGLSVRAATNALRQPLERFPRISP